MTVEQMLTVQRRKAWDSWLDNTDHGRADEIAACGLTRLDGVWRDREASLRHELDLGRIYEPVDFAAIGSTADEELT